MQKRLEDFSRDQLNTYMIDCHGFTAEELKDWTSKPDLCTDIRGLGYAQSCLEYLS